ncbi:hypothetical protein VTN00DRAFT_6254 [Thermoascus crustaceus]|uniref:uncharacterized protein n=1 Tax=Thermoascus crustaceus TaxID=5088 RepID=UPI0037428116
MSSDQIRKRDGERSRSTRELELGALLRRRDRRRRASPVRFSAIIVEDVVDVTVDGKENLGLRGADDKVDGIGSTAASPHTQTNQGHDWLEA